MLDIIGIGSLNLDYTLTTEKLEALPAAVHKELMAKIERGAERFAAEAAIKEIIEFLDNDYFRITLGGSAFNTCSAMAALALLPSASSAVTAKVRAASPLALSKV